MTTVQRTFGTDLSNVTLHQSKGFKTSAGGRALRPKGQLPKYKSKIRPKTELKDEAKDADELLAAIDAFSLELRQEEEKIQEEKTTEKNIKPIENPISFNKSRYEREALLSFREFFTEPIEGLVLIPEICKDYVPPPEVLAQQKQLEEYYVARFASSTRPHCRDYPISQRDFTKKRKLTSSRGDTTNWSVSKNSPLGGVLSFVPVKAQRPPSDTAVPNELPHKIEQTDASFSINAPQEGTGIEPKELELPLLFAVQPVPQPNLIIEVEVLEEKKDTDLPSFVLIKEAEMDLATQQLKLEWIPKTKKEPKSKESNEQRLTARQKQIDIGKNTVGYQRYRELLPKSKRSKSDPQTPSKHQVCSKRSWDGQIRKWRRELHKYDPLSGNSEMIDDEDFGEPEEDHHVEAASDIDPPSPKKKVAVKLETLFESFKQ